ncbi:MAG TPA: hypothetical protein VNA15_07430 [Candidatus Angelobacter sp.]|nr:hypothetical protein [Candidatus Angelobacter sp.]
MLSLGRLRLRPNRERISLFLNQTSPIILTSLISLVIFHGYLLIQQSNGGSDLVSADIPKSLMLLNGQNPYSTQPWASPYPPLLLLTVSGLIRLTGLLAAQSSLDLISQRLRIVGLFADAAVALIIYVTIRNKTSNIVQALIPASLFLTIPAMSTSPLYFFHSDSFGYPILALSILALARRRYLIGTTLLATATAFKVHPILALPLVMIWLIRNQGLRHNKTSLVSTTIITALGLALPLSIPGYQQSVLGFNLSNSGNGQTFSTVTDHLNAVLPQFLQIDASQYGYNLIWITATAALYTTILGTVWTRARSLTPIDVILLGLLSWLIPLRIVYTHYLVWAIIPFLMRGRLKHAIIITGLLQLADTFAYWTSTPGVSPVPEFQTFYGPVLTSAIMRLVGATALIFVLYSIRKNPLGQFAHSVLPAQTVLPAKSV